MSKTGGRVKTSSSSSRVAARHKRIPSGTQAKTSVSVSPSKKEVALPPVAGASELKEDEDHLVAPPVAPSNRHKRNKSIPVIAGSAHDYVSDDESDFTAGSVNFEELDAQVTKSRTFQDMWRVVRLVSAASSYRNMVDVFEREAAGLVHASVVRLWSSTNGSSFRRDDVQHTNHLGVCGYVYSSQEILNLSKAQDDKRFDVEGPDACIKDQGATMCVPLQVTTETDSTACIGVVIAAKAGSAAPFSTRDCTALFRLGQFAGNVIKNAKRLEDANERFNMVEASRKRSAALLGVAKALGSENRLGALVSVIVGQVPELLDCDRCTLFFVDLERQDLIVTRGASHGKPKSLVSWIFGQSNAPELPFSPGTDELRFPMSKGIAGHVGLTGETLNISDAHEDPRFNPEFDVATGYRTRSVLCMPMRDSKGTVIGVVQAINKNPGMGAFTREDETVLEIFTEQAAVAVKNSELYETTRLALDRSEALLEVTNALSRELKLPALLKIIVEKVQKLLRSQRCTVFLVDESKKELYTSDKMTAGMGQALPIDHERDDMTRFPMNRGIAGSVATGGVTVNVPDAYQHAGFSKAMDKETGFRTKSILCMPIRNHKGDIIGVTQVINKLGRQQYEEESKGKKTKVALIRTFGTSDEQMLHAFNAQAAVAIENSRLFTNTERALNHAMADQRNLRFLLNVTKNMFSDMHLSSMIEQMTMQVHHLLKADNSALFLVDKDTKQFYHALAETGSTQGQRQRFPFSVGIVGAVAQSGKTIRISSDAFKDSRFHPSVDQRKGHVTHSILCCPITAETNEQTSVIGVISVRDEKDRGGFEKEEENLLKVFCAQAAVAIINSQRFSNMLDQSDFKNADSTAADYLVQHHDMQISDSNIERFQMKMDELQLLNRIGTGSYGEVYRANVRGQVMAVKKLFVRNLKSEQLESFCQEASLMAQFNHPNVVGFIGAVTEPSNLCIITEFCERGSLADLLLEHVVEMDMSRKLKFMMHAAQGMLYLHMSNPVVLHRDLKSDNLLVTRDWTVKVADFGLTRFLSEKKAMTQVGTPMWMAPEIIMGKKYTEKADVYAFGIILWEILTRLEPYEDKEPMQIVVEVVNDDLRPHIPPEYKDSPVVPLMKDCWHPDPEQRPSFKVIVERMTQIIKAHEKPIT